ncbi:hypothetical protein D8674_027055 [Pyrus ussuriensis x Pyrus communis]|uniref:Uncharacterized protein n=1 Tax=Pyrus ussuriensis x Pyrus communis TaxID=2448454 RepID=A0A5N5ID71_9ROSA|nr:hypothetical protein D8674_027055 [Pyrus ussuriensis x Pyrus communis]
MEMKNPSQEQMLELHNKAEPWMFKPKTGRMMLDQIMQCFWSVADTSVGASKTSNAKKIVSSHVYPSPP